MLPFALAAVGILVLPERAPRGFNSFGVQTYGKQGIGPGWNETVFRATAQAMVDQGLLAKGFDTIVIDGGTSNWPNPHLFDKYGRNFPNPAVWPSSGPGGALGWAPLAKWTHKLGSSLAFGTSVGCRPPWLRRARQSSDIFPPPSLHGDVLAADARSSYSAAASLLLLGIATRLLVYISLRAVDRSRRK
jgi:hypothetical protein